MGLLFPGFLGAALSIGVPIALHLLRRWPRRPVVFPSLYFLNSGSRITERRPQKIRRWLVLLLRCAILALLALAFARPFRGGLYARQTRAVVIVVDNSFSLQTGDRWAELMRWAQSKAAGLEPGDRLGLLLMAPQPTWLVPPSLATVQTLQTFSALRPGWLAARAEPALRLAADTLALIGADRREIVVMTDDQRLVWSQTDFQRPLPPGIAVDFPPAAQPPAHQAGLGVPELVQAPDGILANVPLRNFTGAQKRSLRVFRQGEILALRVLDLDLKAQESRSVLIHLPTPPDEGAAFRFSLDPDDLPADDTAYAVWEPAGDGTVLLDPAASPTDFVASGLTAAAKLKPGWDLKAPPPSKWPSRAVALLRNDDSFDETRAALLNLFLSGGGSALIFATGGPHQQQWLANQGVKFVPLTTTGLPLRVQDWAMDDPLVSALSRRRIDVLLNWDFTAGWSLPPDLGRPLAYWPDRSAAITEMTLGGGKVIVCGFKPDRSTGDWPIRPSFVPFLHQTAAFLFQNEEKSVHAARTGQVLSLGLARGKWQAIDGPLAGQPPVEVVGSMIPSAPGVYEFVRADGRTRYAVNVPTEESDPTGWTAGTPWTALVSPRPAEATPARRAMLEGIEAEQQAPLWRWAVAAAAVLLIVELTLANRTSR